MKRHLWLILILAPTAAYSGQPLRVVEIAQPLSAIGNVIVPVRPLPIPTTIHGPAVQLPGPLVPVFAIRDTIQVIALVTPRQESKSLLGSAQKAFASSPGASGPSAQQLSSGIDGTAKTAVISVGTVDLSDAPKPQPKKQQRAGDPRVIQVPTWELENEIGI